MSTEEITIEQTDEFYQFLQGTCPDGIHVKYPPRLTERKAFAVIWYLQERLRIIPDHYERCCSCGDLYNTSEEGGSFRNRNYCDPCYDNKLNI